MATSIITANNFISNSLVGTALVDATGNIVLDLPTKPFALEGSKYFTIKLRSTGYSGPIIATSPRFNLSDFSSLTSLTANISALNEGDVVKFTVVTTNAAEDSELYYSVFPNFANVTSTDFVANTGYFRINNNLGQFTIRPSEDLSIFDETGENFKVQLRAGSPTGTILTTTSNISIFDTSNTAGYLSNLSAYVNYNSSNKSDNLIFTFNIINAPVKTLYWTTYGTFESANIIGGNTGTIVTAAGQNYQTLNLPLAANLVSEYDSRTLGIQLREDSITGNIKATTLPITLTRLANLTGLVSSNFMVVESNTTTAATISITTLDSPDLPIYWSTTGTLEAANILSGANTGFFRTHNSRAAQTTVLTTLTLKPNVLFSSDRKTVQIQGRRDSVTGQILTTVPQSVSFAGQAFQFRVLEFAEQTANTYTLTAKDGYNILTFNANVANIAVSNPRSANVDFLMVAGGGAGTGFDRDWGTQGSGGGGGVLERRNHVFPGGNYLFEVGIGGDNILNTDGVGKNGGNTAITGGGFPGSGNWGNYGLLALGGGGGSGNYGGPGGSGGGNGWTGWGGGGAGLQSTIVNYGSTIGNFGNNGGFGSGGGATTAGEGRVNEGGGQGGRPFYSNISGKLQAYGGGNGAFQGYGSPNGGSITHHAGIRNQGLTYWNMANTIPGGNVWPPYFPFHSGAIGAGAHGSEHHPTYGGTHISGSGIDGLGGGAGNSVGGGGRGGRGVIVIRYPNLADFFEYLAAPAANVNKGDNITFILSAHNLHGQTMYWNTIGTVTDSDFYSGNSGSFVMSGNIAYITLSSKPTISGNLQLTVRPYIATGNASIISKVVNFVTPSGAILAGGGNVITPGDGYRYHVFTSSNTFSVLEVPSFGTSRANVELLVVGGGGKGAEGLNSATANVVGGGGGAGGVVYFTNVTLTPYTTYSVKVGAGVAAGASVASFPSQLPGGNSTVWLESQNGYYSNIQIEALGGSCGVCDHNIVQYRDWGNSCPNVWVGIVASGAGGNGQDNQPFVFSHLDGFVPGQGSLAGIGSQSGAGGGGGKGGTGQPGAAGSEGGAGIQFPQFAFAVPGSNGYFGGGGGGGRFTGPAVLGGSSVGGRGGNNTVAAQAGNVNTGSGGGGGGWLSGSTGGAAGGSGVVILRYIYP